ncbi:MAG TPA: N-acetyltransferase, partial [Exiguobacterium sp.]|nr:N-acetyltransferase [Exiguobacterium sp.]
MQIRTEIFKDAAGIRLVHQAAFGQRTEADLVEALREDEASLPHYSRVAVTDKGEIVGHVLLSRIYIEDIPSQALVPGGVNAHWPRLGIGPERIRQDIEEAREAGESHRQVLGYDSYYPELELELAVDYGIDSPLSFAPDVV